MAFPFKGSSHRCQERTGGGHPGAAEEGRLGLGSG